MRRFFSFLKFDKNIGIDLGTVNTVIYIEGDGIVLNEPSIVAIDKNDGKVLAVGNDADEMFGKTPDDIIAIKPLKDGVIADYDVAREMIRLFLKKVYNSKKNIIKPRVSISVPSGITNVEKRAVEDAVMSCGAKSIIVLEEPMAAAVGAGIKVDEAKGNMVIDIGGGTTEVAVVSLCGIVASKSIRIAGNAIDEAIINAIKENHNLKIGEKTAEELKIAIGSALATKEEAYEIKGLDIKSGLPKNVIVKSSEIKEAMTENLKEMILAITAVLEKTPPELAGDILDNGIVLTGGGALIKNLDKLINAITGLKVRVAENPLECVALGTLSAVKNDKIIKRSTISRR